MGWIPNHSPLYTRTLISACPPPPSLSLSLSLSHGVPVVLYAHRYYHVFTVNPSIRCVYVVQAHSLPQVLRHVPHHLHLQQHPVRPGYAHDGSGGQRTLGRAGQEALLPAARDEAVDVLDGGRSERIQHSQALRALQRQPGARVLRFTEVIVSPDVISYNPLCGWLGSKHQLSNATS